VFKESEMDRLTLLKFQKEIWQIARQIPAGKVATYGQLATQVNPPATVAAETYKAFAARWVGGAMAACPQDVPWQRVVNSQGKISDRPGSEKQKQLLEMEGVVFDSKGRIDLNLFGWKP
jgi:methylated-DNA-protein-cysteine methyltransferase related protein